MTSDLARACDAARGIDTPRIRTAERDRRMRAELHKMESDVARACDQVLGIDTPRIWTAERDRRMWAELQGDDQ